MDYDFGMAGLMLTFHTNPDHLPGATRKIGRATTLITTPITTRNQLVSLILAKPDISHKELAKALGLTRDGIKYHLNKMKRTGVIIRQASGESRSCA